MRFQKRIKLAPGVRLNLSHRGVSTTIGARGASVNVGRKGVYANTGLPGTGLSHRSKVGGASASPGAPDETVGAAPERPDDSPRARGGRRWRWVVAGVVVLVLVAVFA